jgi:plastocyanin
MRDPGAWAVKPIAYQRSGAHRAAWTGRPVARPNYCNDRKVHRMINTHPAHRRLLLAAGLGSMLIILGACSSGASSSPSQAASQSAAVSASAEASIEASTEASASGGPTVTITGFTSFGASEITVAAGEELTVVNDSSSNHTFTEGQDGEAAADATVNEEVDAGSSATVVFDKPGDYHVTCLFHSAMNMVVHVE